MIAVILKTLGFTADALTSAEGSAEQARKALEKAIAEALTRSTAASGTSPLRWPTRLWRRARTRRPTASSWGWSRHRASSSSDAVRLVTCMKVL